MSEAPGADGSMESALEAASKNPSDSEVWDTLEELADKEQRPEEALEAYRTQLKRAQETELRQELGQRALSFCEEWFGDDPKAVTDLLREIIDGDPAADWAFDRLTVILSSDERWEELLAAYDRLISASADAGRKKELLDDAAHLAKEFAGLPERAADYLRQALELDPDDAKTLASVERLYEKQERWADLQSLWRDRLSRLSGAEGRALQIALADLALERLHEVETSVKELDALLEEHVGDPEACRRLEGLLAREGLDAAIRRRILGILRRNLETAGRHEELLEVLEAALARAEAEDARALHRELGTRLGIAERADEAMEHFAALVRLDPADADARKQLRQLAETTGERGLHANALVAAADAATESGSRITLLAEAAERFREGLGDDSAAIDLYQRILNDSDAERGAALEAAHALNELLEGSEQTQQRLEVLERLGKLERAEVVRRIVLAEAARLAAELGDPDRALADWRTRLESRPSDREALSAVVDLLQKGERWEELVKALRARAEHAARPSERATDLIRAAELLERELDSASEAAQIWLELHGADEPGIELRLRLEALDRLLGGAQRHAELAELLDSAATPLKERAAELLVRLGELRVGSLDRAADGAAAYAQALDLQPQHEKAIEALSGLVEDAEVGSMAAAALARAAERRGDATGVLAVLEARLRDAGSATDRVRLRREAARYQEGLGQREAALDQLGQALADDPQDRGLEAELNHLGHDLGKLEEVAQALSVAAESESIEAERRADLFVDAARLRELELNQARPALEFYRRASELSGHNLEALEGVVRCALELGELLEAADGAVGLAVARGSEETELWDSLEAEFQEGEDAPDGRRLSSVAPALEQSLELRGHAATSHLRAALYARLADWYSRSGDSEAALRAARTRAELRPDDAEARALIVKLLQEGPASLELIQALVDLDGLRSSDLDPLADAAQHLAENENLREGEGAPLHKLVLIRLYRKAARLWARGEETTGQQQASEVALGTLDRLVALHATLGEHEAAARFLLDAVALPVDELSSRRYRRRAAESLADTGQVGRAIDLWHGILEERTRAGVEAGGELEDPEEDLERLATLCEQEGRIAELVNVRARQLQINADLGERLRLRLEASRLAGELERRAGRLESLRQNLEEAPGHPESLAALRAVLIERGRYGDLVELLSAQAAAISTERERSAELWREVAGLATRELQDLERATRAWETSVELHPTREALDELARLETTREHPAAAARWLLRRLDDCEDHERVGLLFRLGRAHLQAGHALEGRKALMTGFEAAPRNAELRRLLVRHLRQEGQPVQLAAVLATACLNAADEEQALRFGREAATLFSESVDDSGAAVEVLARVVELAPEDRGLRVDFASALHAKERFEEARGQIDEALAAFGRRRSPERAAAHRLRAEILNALGEADAALDELELAAKMDSGNLAIGAALGAMAYSAGQLDRAERSYRTLLLGLRRSREGSPVGKAEVLYQLAKIAGAKGDDSQASERLESSLEAVADLDAEGVALAALLEADEDWSTLRKLLELRADKLEAGRERAAVWAQLSSLLSSRFESETEAALAAILSAVRDDPGDPSWHDRAAELLNSPSGETAYRGLLSELLEGTRRGTDAHARVELLLRMARSEAGRERANEADALLSEAQDLGVRSVDVLRARSEVAGLLGDEQAQMELLEQLAQLGAHEGGGRADAFYRIAEVRLSHEDGLEEGLKALREALLEDEAYGRAAAILGQAAERHPGSQGLLELYERSARRGGKPAQLLHYFESLAKLSEGLEPNALREGVQLALEQEEGARAEALLERTLELAEQSLEGASAVPWAGLALGERRLQQGELASAARCLCEAAPDAGLEELHSAAQRFEARAREEGDLGLAARVWECVLERAPSRRAFWEPLAEIYQSTGEHQRLERLVESTLDAMESVEDRSALRVHFAGALLADPDRAERGETMLRAVLQESPGHEKATALLRDFYRRVGRESELGALLEGQLQAAQAAGSQAAVQALRLELVQVVEASDPSRARELIEDALADSPAELGLVVRASKMAKSAGDEARYLELSHSRLELESGADMIRLALELAELHRAAGRGRDAIEVLESARARESSEKIDESLGSLYESESDYEGLSALLEDRARRAADDATRLEMLKRAANTRRTQLNDAAGAAILMRELVEQSPNDEALLLELSACLEAAGQGDEALSRLETAVQAGASSVELRRHLREAFRSRGKLQEALVLAEELAGDGAQEDLGARVEILEAQREACEAAGDLESEAKARGRLLELAKERGDREAQRRLLEIGVERDPEDGELEDQLLALLVDLGDDETFLARGPSRLDALQGEAAALLGVQLAQAFSRNERQQEAQALLEQTHAQAPDAAGPVEALRELYAQAGDRRGLARLDLEAAQNIADPDLRAHKLRAAGMVLLEEGDGEQAMAALRAYAELHPEDPEVGLALVDAEIDAGELDSAAHRLEQALEGQGSKRSPAAAQLWRRKARLLSRQGALGEQLEALQRAHACDKHNGPIAAELADFAEQQQQWDLATKVLRAIALLDAEAGCPISRAESFLRQGKIAHHKGDHKRAVLWARRAKQEDAQLEEASAFLAELGQ